MAIWNVIGKEADAYEGKKSWMEHWEAVETNGLTNRGVNGPADADQVTDVLIFNLSVEDHNFSGPDNINPKHFVNTNKLLQITGCIRNEPSKPSTLNHQNKNIIQYE